MAASSLPRARSDGPRVEMNPAKLGGIDNHREEPWKLPLPAFIEHLYEKRFGKTRPEVVMSIEEQMRASAARDAVRRARKRAGRSTSPVAIRAVAVTDGAVTSVVDEPPQGW